MINFNNWEEYSDNSDNETLIKSINHSKETIVLVEKNDFEYFCNFIYDITKNINICNYNIFFNIKNKNKLLFFIIKNEYNNYEYSYSSYLNEYNYKSFKYYNFEKSIWENGDKLNYEL